MADERAEGASGRPGADESRANVLVNSSERRRGAICNTTYKGKWDKNKKGHKVPRKLRPCTSFLPSVQNYASLGPRALVR